MKTISTIFLSFSLFISLSAKEFPSTIKNVTVYQQGAKITRVANLSLPAGTSEIILSKLSDQINQSSVQASVKGAATIISVKSQYNYLSLPEKTKRVKELQDSVKMLENEIGWLKQERQSYSNQIGVLESNKVIVTGEGKVTAEEVKSLVEYYGAKLTEIKKTIHELDIYTKELTIIFNRVKQQLNQENNRSNKRTGEILLSLLTKAPTTIKLEVNYIVSSAGWRPIYDLRSEEGKPTIDMVYKANIFQNTGYDWKDIQLSVSTGNPFQSNDRPVMNPWYIDFMPVYSPYRKSASRMAIPESNMALEMEDSEISLSLEAKEELLAPEYIVTQKSNQLNARYEIAHSNTILSNNKEHLVILEEYNIGADFKYHAIPKLNEAVFLIAKVGGYGQYNLLEGNANIFLDGAYIGQTYLNPTQVSDSMLISFGRSNNLSVERKILKDLEAQKILGSNTIETRGFEIIVANNNQKKARIEILDQLPIARHEDIKVELTEQGGAQYNEKSGRLFWDIELDANKVSQLKFMYTVKYPKDKKLSGF